MESDKGEGEEKSEIGSGKVETEGVLVGLIGLTLYWISLRYIYTLVVKVVLGFLGGVLMTAGIYRVVESMGIARIVKEHNLTVTTIIVMVIVLVIGGVVLVKGGTKR